MDHLLLPADPARPLPRVEYVCLKEYDKGDFTSYPNRAGWARDELFNRSTWTELDTPGGRSSDHAASFLQEWLFFGLLHAFFGQLVRFSDFIDLNQNGLRFVHTRKLLEISREFAANEEQNKQLLQRGLHVLDSSLVEASAVYNFIRQNPGSTLEPNFLLSLATVGSFLCSLRHILYRDDDPESNLNQTMWEPPSVPAEEDGLQFFRDQNGLMPLLTRDMVRSGWCPQAVFAMSDFFGLETRFFYSYLRNIDTSGRNHSDCTNLQCRACQIDKAVYKSMHANSDCNCEFLEVDPSPTLRQRRIPLVSLVNRGDEPTLELVERTTATPFVAISHVWSDGLGNPNSNKMPLCQLREIQRLVQTLYPGNTEAVPFWIDTLCVPSAAGTAKTEAIKKMRETYALAGKVLVLDATLRKLPVADRSILDQVMHIYSSNWMSRLWTLQEGALSQSLWVSFADATLECARIKDEAAEFHLSLQRGWGNWLDIQLMYGRICGSEKVSAYAAGGKTFDISGICKSLSRRCTSVLSDEALCIGSLLALDMDPIAKATEPTDRMKAFWKSLQTVPDSLMFWRYGTMQDVGFRWAPNTFLGTGSPWLDSGAVRGRPQATPTSSGLLVNAYAVDLESLELPLLHPIDDLVWIRGRDGRWNFFLSKFEVLCYAQNSLLFSIPNSGFSRIALLTTEHISDQGSLPSTHMVMVFVYKQENGVFFARRGDSGLIIKADHPRLAGGLKQRMMSKRDSMLSVEACEGSSRDGNLLHDNKYGAIVGEWSSKLQPWCID